MIRWPKKIVYLADSRATRSRACATRVLRRSTALNRLGKGLLSKRFSLTMPADSDVESARLIAKRVQAISDANFATSSNLEVLT